MQRLAIGGAVLALLFAPLSGNAYAERAPQAQQSAQKTKDKAGKTEPLPVAIVGGVELKQSPAAEQGEQARDEREKSDLRAQWASADAARIQALFSFIGLIGLGFTVYYARKAWRTAQSQLEVLERPYIFVRFSDIEITDTHYSEVPRDGRPQHSHGVFFWMYPRNYGRGPAVVKRISFSIHAAKDINEIGEPLLSFEKEPGWIMPVANEPRKEHFAEGQAPFDRMMNDRLLSGELAAFLTGAVDYEDASGTPFRRAFCWISRQTPGDEREMSEAGGSERNYDERLPHPKRRKRTS
jgi:hypothetical protein